MDVLVDIVRVVHLVSLAVGIGVAAFLEVTIIRNPRDVLDASQLGLIKAGHKLVRMAVIGLWASGLVLLAVRTGFAPSAFTPKLMAKLAVVGLLTANMFAIEHIILPKLERVRDGIILDLPSGERAGIGAIVGLSAGCWISALLLGAVAIFKPMGAMPLVLIFGTLIIGAIICASILAALMGRVELPKVTLPQLRPLDLFPKADDTGGAGIGISPLQVLSLLKR